MTSFATSARIRPGQHDTFELDLERIADHIVARVVGWTISRTKSGRDVDGKPFKPYSASYLRRLQEGGVETTVDLWASGGMVPSTGERSRERSNGKVSVHIGPDTATSRGIDLTPPDKRRAGRSGPGRSPPHHLLGRMHHEGLGRLPRRPWLGVTPAEERKLRAELEALGGAVKLVRAR